uniref:YqaJ viral recombinase domain-containing protein n=1 Tax=Sipha flava TaxID=143950 RepID=A0A2S2Q3G4_9HEMI
MSLEEYDAKKIAFLKKIDLSVDEIIKIERNTVGQEENDDWKKFRKQRLTASNFGKVCKLRPTTSRANTIKYILYDIFQGSSSTRYGIENESIARNAFQKTIKEKIELAGLLFIRINPISQQVLMG